MRMLLTTSDATPTCLCLQAGDEDLSPSRSGLFFERMNYVAITGIELKQIRYETEYSVAPQVTAE